MMERRRGSIGSVTISTRHFRGSERASHIFACVPRVSSWSIRRKHRWMRVLDAGAIKPPSAGRNAGRYRTASIAEQLRRYSLHARQTRRFLRWQFRFSSLTARVRNSCRVSKLPTDDDTTDDKTSRCK